MTNADKTPFNGAELQIIDNVMKQICGQASFDVSDNTHGEIWKLAKNGEEIPLHTIFVEKLGDIGPEQIKIASAGLW